MTTCSAEAGFIFLCTSSRTMREYSLFVHGTTYSLKATVPMLMQNAVTKTGMARRTKLWPDMRMTMSSLAEESREKHMSEPSKIAMGNV